MTAPMTFTFLGETRELATGFAEVHASRLWRYNLHYFDDLCAEGSEARQDWHRAAMDRWIAETAPGTGDGWEPYPTSLRIVNWVKWSLGGGKLEPATIRSLAMQARWLARNMEYHLLGNHLFANAKALVFAGRRFEGSEAQRWLATGLRILAEQVPEQVLADGGHFERSPMYHALALQDVLDLVNVTRVWPLPDSIGGDLAGWLGTALRMREWLRALCHPDGEIAFFNDAARGIAPSPAELDRYGRELELWDTTEVRLEQPLPSLTRRAESGYLRIEGRGAVLLVDVAPVGPDYLPGHAHADTLSFELSLHGQRVVVNGGTSTYEVGPVRHAERSTAAHSTVTVDGENSSEVWSAFRVARRARPFGLEIHETPDAVRVACSHDGYRRLPGRPVHRRTWEVEAARLRVTDRVEGVFKEAVARFHLHPAVAATVNHTGDCGILRLAEGQEVTWKVTAGRASIEHSTWCPEFGRRDATRCLAVRFGPGGGSSVEFTW